MFKKIIKGIALFCGVLFILIVGIAIFSDSEKGITAPQKEALERAEYYLNNGNCSKEELKTLLLMEIEFGKINKEGVKEEVNFTEKDVKYAIEKVKVDYFDEAYADGKEFLEFTGGDITDVTEYLKIAGYAPAEIRYAVNKLTEE